MGIYKHPIVREVFSRKVFSNIFNLCPEKEHLKLSKATEIHGRFTKETMENLLKRLEEKRKDKERMQKEKDKGSGGGSDATGSRSHPSQQNSPLIKQEDFRVCKELEKQGGHTGLFLNHLGRFIHGCPKFLAM